MDIYAVKKKLLVIYDEMSNKGFYKKLKSDEKFLVYILPIFLIIVSFGLFCSGMFCKHVLLEIISLFILIISFVYYYKIYECFKVKKYSVQKNKEYNHYDEFLELIEKKINDKKTENNENDNETENQQPRPKGTWYVVLIRYLHSRFNTFLKRPKGRGIKPLSTNKEKDNKIDEKEKDNKIDEKEIDYFIELMNFENISSNNNQNGFYEYLTVIYIPVLMVYLNDLLQNEIVVLVLTIILFLIPVVIFLNKYIVNLKKNKYEIISKYLEKRKIELKYK